MDIQFAKYKELIEQQLEELILGGQDTTRRPK